MPDEDNEQGTVRYVRCPSCGAPNPGTSTACFRCGKPIEIKSRTSAGTQAPKVMAPPGQVICSNCRKALPAGSKFCGYCGTPLLASAPAVATLAPPSPPAERSPVPPPAAALANVPVPPVAGPPPVAASLNAPAAPPAPAPPPVTGSGPTEPRPSSAPPPPAQPAAPSVPVTPGTQKWVGFHVPTIEADIVEVKPDGTTGKALRIMRETVIGRGPCDASYPNDVLLSPRHAELYQDHGKLYLKDLGSQNGTFVKQRQDTELTPGDVFLLGRELFRFKTQRLDESLGRGSAEGTVVMTAPPKLQPGPITAKLEHIQLSGEVIEEFSLEKPETTIGRTTGDLVFKNDPYMSGTHARIVAQPGRFILKDLKSRNGVYRRIRDEVEVVEDDEFFLGEQLFRVAIKVLEG